jgi:RNA polymerase sigma-70 factor (ECF subfamily)
MADTEEFADFVRRLRAGDAEAAAALVRRYEPAIRLEVRLRLRDPRLRRLFDSTDVCQSVLATFFVRAAAGEYDLHDPRDLVKLLARIARNKVADQARHHRAQRRDSRRAEALPAGDAVAAADPSPSRVVMGRELLQEVRRHLSAAERQIADLRAEGLSWEAVAQRMGGTADGRRVQLGRALGRALRALGLGEGGEE